MAVLQELHFDAASLASANSLRVLSQSGNGGHRRHIGFKVTLQPNDVLRAVTVYMGFSNTTTTHMTSSLKAGMRVYTNHYRTSASFYTNLYGGTPSPANQPVSSSYWSPNYFNNLPSALATAEITLDTLQTAAAAAAGGVTAQDKRIPVRFVLDADVKNTSQVAQDYFIHIFGENPEYQGDVVISAPLVAGVSAANGVSTFSTGGPGAYSGNDSYGTGVLQYSAYNYSYWEGVSGQQIAYRLEDSATAAGAGAAVGTPGQTVNASGSTGVIVPPSVLSKVAGRVSKKVIVDPLSGSLTVADPTKSDGSQIAVPKGSVVKFNGARYVKHGDGDADFSRIEPVALPEWRWSPEAEAIWAAENDVLED